MKRCRTCKWWIELCEQPFGTGHLIGRCDRLYELAVDEQPMFCVSIQSTDLPEINEITTGMNFGCTEHEVREMVK